jgi:hypothetical protein
MTFFSWALTWSLTPIVDVHVHVAVPGFLFGRGLQLR